MRKAVIAVLVSILSSTFAFAQNNRSAVSLTGNDSAACTVPDPCRTFDVAISHTNAGGEVIVLSSAGYGPFTVTKSVSIISPPAYHAAIAPTSGDAITVNVDSAAVVLRGLTLNGSLGGVNGITYTGAAMGFTTLYVENCVISGFTGNGINFTQYGTLFVSELIARGNGAAIFVDSPNQMTPSVASIDHALMEKNNVGLYVEHATVGIRNSLAARSGFVGFWALANVAGKSADLSVDNCQATHNSYGMYAGGGSGTARLTVSNSVSSANFNYGMAAFSNGTVRASNITATKNSVGMYQNGSGVFRSAGNNIVDGNSAETSGTITTFGPM